MYSFLDPCECKDKVEKCEVHYDKSCIFRLISWINSSISGDILEGVMRFYISLSKFIEEEPLFSKEELLDLFPFKDVFSLISESKKKELFIDLLNVFIRHFIEDAEYVRRVIAVELGLKNKKLTMRRVNNILEEKMWLPFRNVKLYLEVMSECESKPYKDNMIEVPLARDVVKMFMTYVDGDGVVPIIALQILTEVVYSFPSLGALFDDKRFIQKVLHKFVKYKRINNSLNEAENKMDWYKSYWGGFLMTVLFSSEKNVCRLEKNDNRFNNKGYKAWESPDGLLLVRHVVQDSCE
jgi:hypothetical protein